MARKKTDKTPPKTRRPRGKAVAHPPKSPARAAKPKIAPKAATKTKAKRMETKKPAAKKAGVAPVEGGGVALLRRAAIEAAAKARAGGPAHVVPERFRALVVEQGETGLATSVRTVGIDDLLRHAPDGADVTVRVLYSSVNFKDGLAMAGLNKVVRSYPHVPGVDLVGVVEDSASPSVTPGDVVIGGGFRVGELYWGGHAEYARLRSDQVVPLPAGLTPRRAMAIGAAGLTAMLAVMALEEHGIGPGAGEVLVTGAAGGVGSIAVAVLANLGHNVVAATGRRQTHDYLRGLGAASFISRQELAVPPKKPLLPERWIAAVDAVGGVTLANILASLMAGGSVAATGNVAGHAYPASVLPFILRGVNLLGIEVTNCPVERRHEAWGRLLRDLPPALLDRMITEVPLKDAAEIGRRILKGGVQGRVVVDVTA
jgi:acrylyl-CoA reductase (NADPH)